MLKSEENRNMLLKSLITNDSKMTIHIDDEKKGFRYTGTIAKGSEIEVPDEAYWYREVQDAIKLGFAELIGEAPPLPPAAEQAQFKTLKNIKPFKVTLDFIKNYAEPNGGCVEVPIELMGHAEVRSALKLGWLIDESAPPVPVKEPAAEEKATTKKADGPKAMKAKRVGAHDDVVIDTSADKAEPGSLFSESRVRVPGEAPEPKVAPKVDDMFSESKVRVPDASKPKDAPKNVVNPDDLFERWWSDDESK